VAALIVKRMMSAASTRPAELWQHRVLGVSWFALGLALIRWFFKGDFWWHDSWPYLPLAAGSFCLVSAAGFFACRSWARLLLGILAAVIGLAAFDLMLCSIFESPQDLWLAVGGVSLAGYTLLFIVFSWLNHRKGEYAAS
jgi:hypothetical protein